MGTMTDIDTRQKKRSTCCGGRTAAGVTEEDPVLIGEAGGETIFVVALINGWTFRRGETGWISGTDAQSYIDQGWFQLVEEDEADEESDDGGTSD